MSSFSMLPGASSAFKGLSNRPTIVLSAAAGSTATASVDGTNSAIATGKILTLNFADSFQYSKPPVVADMAGNDGYAAARAQLYVKSFVDRIELWVRWLALGAGDYVGYYVVVG